MEKVGSLIQFASEPLDRFNHSSLVIPSSKIHCYYRWFFKTRFNLKIEIIPIIILSICRIALSLAEF